MDTPPASAAAPTLPRVIRATRALWLAMLLLIALAPAALATEGDPSTAPTATSTPDPTPTAAATAAPSADPTPSPGPTATPAPATPDPTPTAAATATAAPRSTARPTPAAPAAPRPPGAESRTSASTTTATRTSIATDSSTASLTSSAVAGTPPPPPEKLNLYVASGFRYQDPNPYACTSTSVMDMLNFIALKGTGGSGFRWSVSLSGAKRDSILAWERVNDTLKGGDGSDPHGWRNALNYYGWGSGALQEGKRVYDDRSYSSYATAVKTAVRQLIRTRKPVGILARRGQHAQMMTGYYGLSGDPFKKLADGSWANDFTVGGFYISDPLRSSEILNKAVSYATFRDTTNLKLRLQRYYETDSPYDDPYTAGTRASKDEWYGLFVLILPIR